MKTLNIITAFIVLGAGCQQNPPEANATSDLVVIEINNEDLDSKKIKMKFEELEREEKTSTIKVTHEEGTSVVSAMFIVRGCYEIAKHRNKRYFANIRHWRTDDGSWMYLVGFSDDGSVNPIDYFELEGSYAGSNAIHFLSVSNYGKIFDSTDVIR